MTFDCHVHTGKLQAFLVDGKTDELLRDADRHGVEKLFCTEALALLYDMREGNRKLAEWMKEHPDRVYGYASICSPRYGQEAVDEVRRCIEDYEMHGLKIYSFTQPITGKLVLSVDDPWMDPVLEKAVEYDVPVLAHSSPAECEALCARFPDLKLIMAHAGNTLHAGGDWHRALSAAKRHSHLYLDTATSTTDLDFMETAAAEVGAERLVYGSDWPLFDMGFALARVTGSALTEEQKGLVLGGNLARLVRRGM